MLVKKSGNARSLKQLLKIIRGFIFWLQSASDGICFDDDKLFLHLVENSTVDQLSGYVHAARLIVLDTEARAHDCALFSMIQRLVMFHLSYASYDFFFEQFLPTFWWLKLLPTSMPACVER